MSDYSKATDFAAKDGLTTGDPSKVVVGTEIDDEFNAISVAVATKYDSTDLASQVVAEAGANNTTLMTPLRVAQYVAGFGGAYDASSVAITGGTINGVVVGGVTPGAGTFSTLAFTSFTYNGTAITATAAELNVLDGITSTVAELNILDGVTSTAAEINILDGVTSTTAELNILDGVTSTAAELNLLDGVTATTAEINYLDVTTAGTAQASKALVASAGSAFNFNNFAMTNVDINSGAIDGTAIGGTTPAAVAGTTVSASGALTAGAEIVETVYGLSGTTPALNPANGTIQTWTLVGNSTPTDSLAAGEYITLMIDDGLAYTITWPTMQWVGGSAPTLDATNATWVELWKVSTTLFGALVGVSS